MKLTRKLLVALGCVMALNVYASIPNHDDETPLLGPTLRLSHTAFICDDMAYSVAGELGVRNIRVSATFGYQIAENQRLKGTAEILSQKLTFGFFSGNEEEWVSQGALGADYLYDLNFFHNSQLELTAFYSYAGSRHLRSQSGFYLQNGVSTAYFNARHLAGAHAFGVNPAYQIEPWVGTKVGLQLNYDNVHYNTWYDNAHSYVSGFGGTARISQLLTDGIAANTIISIRQPFNYYYLDISFIDLTYMGRWNVGLYSDYVDGKRHLPSSWNIGVRADYLLDPMINSVPTIKGEISGPSRPIDPFITWVADPAVRMPQVLVIADESVRTSCGAGFPIVVGTLPDDPSGISTTTDYPTAQAFAGTGLTYSIANVTTTNPADTTVVSIDAATGVVTVDPQTLLGNVVTITVRASNSCGAVTASFSVTVQND